MLYKKKIALIGAGFIANEYLRVAEKSSKFTIKSIYSRSKPKIIKLKKKYNLDYTFTNFKEFSKHLKIQKIDGIIVGVSVENMYEVLKSIIILKIPLLIEKPPCLNISQLKKLISLQKKYLTPNMIALNRRYYSVFQKVFNKDYNENLNSIIIEGHENIWKINKKNIVKKNWLLANSIHTIDLLFFFSCGSLKKISINKNKKNNQFNIETLMTFDNSVSAIYQSNWNNYGRWSVIINVGKIKYTFKPLESGFVTNRNGKIKEIPIDVNDKIYKAGFYNMLKSFIKLIETKKNDWPDVNLNSVLKTYELIKKLS